MRMDHDLPTVPPEARPSLPAAAPASGKDRAPAGDLPVVLLVDDLPDNLFALEAMLRRDDVEIITTTSGREALEVLLRRDVAVAIVDVMMPEMDGFEWAELVRGVNRTRRVPIIFVTAGSRAEYRVFTGYETGAIDFLFKPISETVLRAKVDVLVTLEQQRRALERSRAETQVLLRLAQATFQTEVPEAVYEPALDAVRELFDAERASILLFDETDKLRFRAWRGLSDRYRAAVDGHSPWARGDTAARPIFIADAARDEAMAPYREVFAAEGIGSVAFVPLLSHRRLLGKFMLYWEAPRAVSDHDRELAQAIAAQIADALERARLLEAERLARAEAKLAEERLRVALSAGNMGVWEWSVQSGKVRWSETLEAIHGLAPGTFAGTFEAFEADIHPEDLAQVRERARSSLEARREHQVEYRIVRPDGEQRWLAGYGKPVALGDRPGEQVLTMMGVCMDITEKKQSEQARERALAELEETLHYNELFAAVLAHDLRNPLSAILTATQLELRRREGGERTGDKSDVLDRVMSAGLRMSRMIDQLLDFTRARVGGGFSLEPRATDLAALCKQVLDELELARPEWRVELHAAGDTQGSWDPDRLLQVVSNLLANAGQHGVAGTPVQVRLDGSDPAALTLAVHNQGSIAPQLLPNLFLPFRGTRERGPGGLGLGLFIARQLVLSHGGTLSVESTEAAGTTFTVRLPRRSAK